MLASYPSNPTTSNPTTPTHKNTVLRDGPTTSTSTTTDFEQSHWIHSLRQEADQLSYTSKDESSYETSVRLQRLQQLNRQLEQTAITLLETHMVEVPGGGDALDLNALNNLADSPLTPESVKIAIHYLLENPSKLDALNTADQRTNSSYLSLEFAVTLADLQARQFAINNSIPGQAEIPDSAKHYQVPTHDQTYVTGALDTPNRPTSLYANQQNNVEFAIRTGLPVSFHNSNGKALSITIVPLETRGAARYRVSMEGGTQFDVRSHLGTSRTIEAITNIIEWGTTFNARAGIKHFPDTVVFDNKAYSASNTAASYLGRSHTMTFYRGHQYISEANYNHEMAHGIGWQQDESRSNSNCLGGGSSQDKHNDYTPENWESTMLAATTAGIDSITHYAETSPAEDFAESLSAYMNARDNGPAALNAIRRVYPHRTNYLEKHIFSDSMQR